MTSCATAGWSCHSITYCGASYYATYQDSGDQSPAIIAFCDWLQEITSSGRVADQAALS